MLAARFFIILLVVTVLSLGFSSSTLAAGKNGTLEVVPAFVEVSVTKADEEKQVPIDFINHSNSYLSLSISALDFKQEGDNGQISFVGQTGSYSYSLSSFLSFDADTLELPPQEKKTLLVTVKNRQDLSPGGHYAAVVGKVVPSGSSKKAELSPSLASLILVRKVGGEQFNLSLKDISWPTGDIAFSLPKSITLLFQNEGNIHLVPYGRVTITDMFGRTIADGLVNPSSLRVFPSSQRFITADLTSLAVILPFSLASVNVQGQDSLHKTTFLRRESFIFINPTFIIVVLVLFGILYWTKKKLNRAVKSVSDEKIAAKKKGRKA